MGSRVYDSPAIVQVMSGCRAALCLKVHSVSRKFPSQIVYAGLTNICQHSTTDLARGMLTNGRKQSALSKARSFKHSKTTSTFFYSIYHQGAGKTSLFYGRGVDFTHFNTCCTFKTQSTMIPSGRAQPL